MLNFLKSQAPKFLQKIALSSKAFWEYLVLTANINSLTTLDVHNTALTELYCPNNQLKKINVQNNNNANMNTFIFSDNPGLTCIQVDDATNIPSNWDQSFTGYSTDCFSIVLSTDDIVSKEGFDVYPNPVSNLLYITNENLEIKEITVYNLAGKIVKKEKNITKSISLNHLSKGTYILKITTNKGVGIKRIVKK